MEDQEETGSGAQERTSGVGQYIVGTLIGFLSRPLLEGHMRSPLEDLLATGAVLAPSVAFFAFVQDRLGYDAGETLVRGSAYTAGVVSGIAAHDVITRYCA